MTNRVKTMLMTFVDYLLCMVLQLLGLFIFSWLINFSWGYPVYSVIFTLVLFGMLYIRTHKAAKRDLRKKENCPGLSEGIIMVLPLAVLNFLIILLFGLIQYNIIPIRDMVISTVYTFPDNEPRVMTEISLLDTITPFVRIWFGVLVGFMTEKTSALVLLVMPVLTLLAGFLGYLAGKKKFFLSDVLFSAKEKVKEKFNE